MNYHIEKLNEQTWLIEEYSNTASAYMYLLTGREKALLKILPLMNWLKSLRKQIKTGFCPKSRMDIREKKQYGIIGILTWHTVICFLK